MKRILIIGLLILLAACTPAENEGGTAIPSAQSGAPLYDEAIGPSDEEEPIEGAP
jgi:hypothetical protein